MLYDVFSHPIYARYRADVFSKATAFQVISLALTIILPLLVAYRSQGFWLKTNTYLEQPLVTWNGDFILMTHAEGHNAHSFWSSYPGLNSVERSHITVPLISTHVFNHNRDSKPDVFEFTATFPAAVWPEPGKDDVAATKSAKSSGVRAVECLLFFTYKLELGSRVQAQTAVRISEASIHQAASSLTVYADLALEQRVPLKWRGRDTRWDTQIIPTNILSQAAEYGDINRIVEAVRSRNISTTLARKEVVWRQGAAGLTPFTLRVKINIPTQTIEYATGFWELIKWAWVQYLAVLVVFAFVANRIRRFVFINRLVFSMPVAAQRSAKMG